MKNQLYILLLVTGFVTIGNHCFAQANKTLSNLNSPTAVNQNLLPDTDNSKDLGSSSKAWRGVYLDGYLYLDGTRILHTDGGLENTFLGHGAGSIIIGSGNSAFGYYALLHSNGSDNSVFGTNAGHGPPIGQSTGSYNSFFGNSAGYSITDGSENSFFGEQSGYSNTTGAENAFFGEDAGYFNTTGEQNAFFGADAGQDNTTGNYNTFVGRSAGLNNTAESYNSYFGFQAAFVATGGDNTSMGAGSGFHLTTGDENTFIGQNAGYTLSTGNNVTCIGDFARVGSGALNNATAIGSDAIVSSSNYVRIGSSSVTSIGGYAGWTNLSDGRYKKNVKEDVAGLDFITKLRPVTYTLDITGVNNFFGNDEEASQSEHKQQAITEKERIVYTGFIAQEVEEAAKETGYDFSGVDVPKNENDLYGLRYAEFVVPLVKAVQELDLDNKTLRMENDELKTEVNDLRSRLERIESQLGITGELKQSSGNVNRATLEQNIPNPANNTTTIGFYLPSEASNAQLIITDASGKTIQQFSPLSGGQSHVEISTYRLSAGTYQYSLYVDGKNVDTKQMIISK